MKVLIVEDEPMLQRMWKRKLEADFPNLLVLTAYTVEEAKIFFLSHSDLVVIVMDACVPGHQLNTLELTRDIRASYRGPMLAMSNYCDYLRLLVDAGCDYEIEKSDVLKVVRRFLPVHLLENM